MASPPENQKETDDAALADETLGSVIRVKTVWALSVVTVILLGAMGLLYDRLRDMEKELTALHRTVIAIAHEVVEQKVDRPDFRDEDLHDEGDDR